MQTCSRLLPLLASARLQHVRILAIVLILLVGVGSSHAYSVLTHEEIVDLLETGNTPDFDVIGGAMAAVQENMAKLTPEDCKDIASYLKSLPPRPNAVPKEKKASKDDEDERDEAGDKAAPESGDAGDKRKPDEEDY